MTADVARSSRHAERDRSNEGSGILQIALLGGFRVSVGEQALLGPTWRRKAAQLVQLLALSRDHTRHREDLCDALWPDRTPEAQANNLRQALHVARRTLRTLPLEPDAVLCVHAERVCLYPADCLRVDIEALERAADAARRSDDPALYWAAIDRYTGPLLPDEPYADWAAARRAALDATYLSLLDDVVRLHESRGEDTQASAALRRIITAEPADEAAHVRLMRLHARNGRRALALRQYEQLTRILARELDVAPEPATQELARAITAGRFPTAPPAPLEVRPRRREEPTAMAPPAAATPAAATAHSTTNLPPPLTSFIGRQADVAHLVTLLQQARLITLTGPGGSGKTRLALEVGRGTAARFPDGVWLVELTPLRDASLVAAAVAATLGVREEADRYLDAVLVDHLRRRHLLLILDNCEHLVDGCVTLVQRLLQECPDLYVLTTSRARLRLEGEAVWPVAPLAVPAPGQLERLDDLAAVPAVRLFLERARAIQPQFALTPATAAPVVTICRRLDGLPLAIELAAARIGVLSPAQLAERLTDSLTLLVAPHSAVAERHRALRATLAWSYAMLDPAAQTLFRRLAVFRGGFTLDGAEALWLETRIRAPSVLDLLSELVDHSFVQVDPQTPDAYRMHFLEPIRQYAAEQLATAGELAAARDRHAVYFLRLAEAAEPALAGAEQASWLARLAREHDNLRDALAHLRARGDTRSALRLATALWRFWYVQGHFTEGVAVLIDLLDGVDGTEPALRARALLSAGALAYRAGRLREAATWLTESVAIFRDLGDAGGGGWATAFLGHVAGALHEDARAIACAEESLALFRRAGDRAGMARALNALGEVSRMAGDDARAAALYEEALALDRQQGDRYGMALRLHNLGYVALHRGARAAAAERFLDGLRHGQQLGDGYLMAICVEGCAATAAVAGLARTAARLFGTAEHLRAVQGLQIDVGDLPEHERFVALARSGLPASQFAVAWSAGRQLTPGDVRALVWRELVPAAPQPLTPREQQIADLVAQGLTNPQIAVALGLAERTVDTHVGRILRKLGLNSRHAITDHLGDLTPPVADR